MIAKIPVKRGDGRSSFSTLSRYIAGDKLDRSTGEIVRAAADVVCVTNCLSLNTASAEMKAAAYANPRIKYPVYHVVLSWREGERPTDKQMIEAAKAAQKAVSMDGHQFVYAIHRDTENAHVHMMINRVHPDSAKAIYPQNDFYKLDRCMREMELAQGWGHDNGPYTVKDGMVIRGERDLERRPSQPTKAKDFEAATGHQSLAGYAQSVADEVIKSLDAGTWQDLHAALRKYGLEIREAGQGFKIHSVDDPKQTPIKASNMAGELGGGKLKKRLGEFERPVRTVAAARPERTYQRDPAGRVQQREERAAERAALKQQYKEACLAKRAVAGRRDAKAEFAKLRAEAKAVRERVRSEGYDKAATKYLLSIAAMEAVQKRDSLKASLRDERDAKRPPSYQQWVADRAEAGDKGAITQLKGWQYQDARKRAAAEKAVAEEAEQGAMAGGARQEDVALGEITRGIRWMVDRATGDVTYHSAGGRELLRDTGRQVSVLDQQSDQAITAGLLLASQKFGGKLTLTGSEVFQRRAVELAVQQNMQVRFLDPAAEQYRLQLIRHQEQGNGNERTRASDSPASPSSRRTTEHRMQNMLTSDVVKRDRSTEKTRDGSVLRGDESQGLGEPLAGRQPRGRGR